MYRLPSHKDGSFYLLFFNAHNCFIKTKNKTHKNALGGIWTTDPLEWQADMKTSRSCHSPQVNWYLFLDRIEQYKMIKYFYKFGHDKFFQLISKSHNLVENIKFWSKFVLSNDTWKKRQLRFFPNHSGFCQKFGSLCLMFEMELFTQAYC